MFDEPALSKVVGMSILPKKRFFALSALATHELNELASLRDTVWSTHKKESEGFRDIATMSLSFPWSENPAHALLVSAIERWSEYDLETMLRRFRLPTTCFSAILRSVPASITPLAY